MSVHTSMGQEALHIYVRGELDSAEVENIEAALADADVTQAVVIDFRETRSFRPASLAQLARDLSASIRHVSLHGLSEYHYRLLRYAPLPHPGSA